MYVQQPEDFLVKGQEDKVYRLKKALYGLKQAPQAWNARIDGYLHHNYLPFMHIFKRYSIKGIQSMIVHPTALQR